MSKRSEWFPFNVCNYLADTSRFTTLQHGAYLVILLEYWRNNGRISSDMEELQEIVQLDQKAFDQVMPAVLKQFETVGSDLKHSELDKELEKRKTKKTKFSSFGSKDISAEPHSLNIAGMT